MYKFINTNGEIVKIKKRVTLKEMQQFVGGYIEQVENIICNEDGNLLKLPVNKYKPIFVGNIIEKGGW